MAGKSFLDYPGFSHFWENLKALLNKKQDKLLGSSGEIVTFDSAGNPTSVSPTNVPELKGEKGDKGDKGDTGPQGPQGPAGSSSSNLPVYGASSTRTYIKESSANAMAIGANSVNIVSTTNTFTVNNRMTYGVNINVNSSGNSSNYVGLGGNLSHINGASCLAIGMGVVTNGLGAIAIGRSVKCYSSSGLVIGDQSNCVSRLGGLALGSLVNCHGNSSIVIGSYSRAGDNSTEYNSSAYMTVMGYRACCYGNYSFSLGKDSKVYASNSIAIGANSRINTLINGDINPYVTNETTNCIAIGANAHIRSVYNSATAVNATYNIITSGIAIGPNASVSGTGSISIGHQASSSEEKCISIGLNSYSRKNGVSIGANSYIYGFDSIAIGLNAIVYGTGSGTIVIGANARSGKNPISMLSVEYGAIAIGKDAEVHSNYSISLGSGAKSNFCGLAVGTNTLVTANYSTALGYGATASTQNTIKLGGTGLSALMSPIDLSVSSDERDKTEIYDIEDGATEFLRNVRAIRYLRNPRDRYEDEETMTEEQIKIYHKYGLYAYDKESHALGTKKGSRVRVGVLAQEVQSALFDVYGDSSYGNLVNDNFYDYDPDTIPEGAENQLTVNYSGFIPFLIKAIQELDERITRLE